LTNLAWSSLQREVAIVLVVRDCSRTFPSRGTTHSSGEQLYRMAADADVFCAIPHRMGHSILCDVRLATSVYWLAVTTSRVTFELAQAGGISSRTGRLGSNNHRQTGIRFSFLSLHALLFSLCLLVRRLGGRLRPARDQAEENARHSAYVLRFVSICQKMVASFRMTATRAMLEPRRRLMRLNHSRMRTSLLNAW
jgi:hypothetical protein